MNDAIQALLHPQSIAVIGASSDFNKINGRTLKALVDKGYSGRIFPVNPKYDRIGGLKCYPDIASLPEAPDLAVVAVPARAVAASLRALGERGIRARREPHAQRQACSRRPAVRGPATGRTDLPAPRVSGTARALVRHGS